MTLFINPIEAIWVATNGLALIVTGYLIRQAVLDRNTVRALNGRAREIAVNAAVRRESLTFLIQLSLLSISLPSLFVNNTITINPVLIVLICVPILLMVNSILDARARHQLTVALRAELAGP